MIKAVCAEKAQKLLFSRLEPDRFIIPRLCVSSADSGNVTGLGRCLHVLGGGAGWKHGIPERAPLTPTACWLLTSPAPSEPSPAARLIFPPACPRACHRERLWSDGSARTSVLLPISLLPLLSPLQKGIFKGTRKEWGVNGARLLGRHQELGGWGSDSQCLLLIGTQ